MKKSVKRILLVIMLTSFALVVFLPPRSQPRSLPAESLFMLESFSTSAVARRSRIKPS